MKNRSRLLAAVVAAAVCCVPAAFADVRPDPTLTKNSSEFKKGFEPIVAKANKATVEVLSDGKRAVLGAVVSADGYIVTKASELKGKITVRNSGGADFPARLIGVVNDDDIAMIKIEAKDLPVVDWASEKETKKIEPGDMVAVAGIISDRPVAVGIVSLQRREIPPEAAALGVSLSDAETGKGAKILQVVPGSGAEKAGVKVDDAIISINDKPIKTRIDLTETISKLRPGDVIKLKVDRAGKVIDMTATLGVRQAVFSAMNPRLEMQNLLQGQVSARASAFPIVIQHDAVLRPTECGGPLLNVDGKAIGINIARGGRTETYAIPADVVIPLIKDLQAGKYAAVVEVKKEVPATSAAPTTKPEPIPMPVSPPAETKPTTSPAPSTAPAK